MIKKAIFILFLCFFSFLSISLLIADQRVENIEVYLILDKSLSMVEEIETVKEYVLKEIVQKIVVEGDYFLLLPFYGNTDNSFNGYISSGKELEVLKSQIQNIEADGKFTDIGNALETLRYNIKSDISSVRKYMLLITDGKQEAPPDSPFYSADGSFNHEFLKNTKEIQKSGWKIIVLGIGTESAAKEIAKELSASYSVVPDTANSQDIIDSIGNFLGRLDLTLFPDQITLDKAGNSIIELEITSTDYNEAKNIKILKIEMISEKLQEANILKKIFEFKVESGDTAKINIPVVFPVNEKDYDADIVFIFDNENSFTPAVHHIKINMSKGIPFFVYLLLLAFVVLIVIFYSLKIIRRKRMEDYEKDTKGV